MWVLPTIRTAENVINRNMRCIEMVKQYKLTKLKPWINRNMRCIEIHALLCYLPNFWRLIET
ncbi:hypothetical protein IMSAGC011_02862 [Lachnospiraceae bacterium]|nr:hypothetical protein IMSAGC011_02862 [Lachnospiraceae bacterium]